MNKKNEKKGIGFGLIAYLMWGILPVYWHLLTKVTALDILAYRIIFSFIFMSGILLFTGKINKLFAEIKNLLSRPKQFFALFSASVLVVCNWGVYIWSVNSGHIVEASLGYYINPLVSVLLGVGILKEKLNLYQVFAVILAVIGVLIVSFDYGNIPIISITLAASFGMYGLIKKILIIDAISGIAIESLLIAPFAIFYLTFFAKIEYFSLGVLQATLIIGAGAVTAIPLLYFTKAAKLVPLSTLGFIQYVAPTLMLLLGVFAYNEPFRVTKLISFAFIWTSLFLFSLTKTKWFEKNKKSLVNIK